MIRPKRKWQLTVVDFLVGVAVLMILTALVVPIFVPPDGRAAAKAAVTRTFTKPTHH
jgi:hypothetical protein